MLRAGVFIDEELFELTTASLRLILKIYVAQIADADDVQIELLYEQLERFKQTIVYTDGLIGKAQVVLRSKYLNPWELDLLLLEGCLFRQNQHGAVNYFEIQPLGYNGDSKLNIGRPLVFLKIAGYYFLAEEFLHLDCLGDIVSGNDFDFADVFLRSNMKMALDGEGKLINIYLSPDSSLFPELQQNGQFVAGLLGVTVGIKAVYDAEVILCAEGDNLLDERIDLRQFRALLMLFNLSDCRQFPPVNYFHRLVFGTDSEAIRNELLDSLERLQEFASQIIPGILGGDEFFFALVVRQYSCCIEWRITDKFQYKYDWVEEFIQNGVCYLTNTLFGLRSFVEKTVNTAEFEIQLANLFEWLCYEVLPANNIFVREEVNMGIIRRLKQLRIAGNIESLIRNNQDSCCSVKN
ncbi:MAG: hypothetical protein WCP79_14670 [Bacillota bacterium]